MVEGEFCSMKPSRPIKRAVCNGNAAHNKQLQRTVKPQHRRGASASFHCAHAARWTRDRAAAELRRYAAGFKPVEVRVLWLVA